MIPEPSRSKLLSLVGDLRLFKESWPEDLIWRLMSEAGAVKVDQLDGAEDKLLMNQILVVVLALLPRLQGEELPAGLSPETISKFGRYMLDDIHKRLTG